ncbi:MAG: hypothetical protein IKJ36_01680 [Clostridia bacterium]|nr:hypothetical protein [Clostridia bacterium]
MMKKNKLILLQIFVAFTLICSSVYAAVNTTIAVKASKNSVLRGEKVSVTLSLENVDNEKVEEVEGYVNYDSNIVEPITFESIQKDAENKVKIGNEVLVVEDVTKGNLSASSGYIGFNSDPSSGNDTRFVIEFNDGITEDVDLMTIDFVVKEDATLGEIKNAITYSTFVVTADAETSEEITKNVTLTVKAENAPADDDSNENKNENTNSNTNSNENKNENKNTNSNTNTNSKNENKNTNTNTKNENKNTNKNTNTNTNQNKNTNKAGNTNTNTKDNTVSGTNLPATGAKMIIIPAIVLLVLAYVSYNKYMKYKNV